MQTLDRGRDGRDWIFLHTEGFFRSQAYGSVFETDDRNLEGGPRMAETQNKVGMDNSCYRAVDYCAHDYEGKMGVIRMDIEQTRADMGDTVDAIAKKI